ncbi:hypothetical protein [Variovorax sp. Sphag1AA]|uniref:hypothetical protein n=1 Tax=Variovorax sp. Sphag1AA TaxID=2587027 RepID=UPI0016209AF2|nr:hypothetical protein [Variovorax sp. Sphag1AA]MBB3180282.1 hypothetical protein [Variovorax sp. Sphag1AA]
MAEEEKSKSWWQTLPGFIASLTAATTAAAGLLVALKQVGWIGSPQPPAPPTPQQQQSSQGGGTSSAPSPSPAPAASAAAAAPASHPVTLPELREYKLGPATFTLLSATLSPQTAEKDALKIQVRMLNNNTYDANFWDKEFRLILDGVPMAPESNLNELVAARSAKDGTVMFVVPRGTASVNLQIDYADQQTVIPLTLAAPR